MTLTVTPVFFLKSGSRYSNRPESCVDVVEATTIDLSCLRECRVRGDDHGDERDGGDEIAAGEHG